jgi:hypothetical protein
LKAVKNIKLDSMNAKGIGPQGLGVKTHNGFWIGSGSGSGPIKQTVKDSCYKKVKATYDVFPSAYASGAIAKCRKNKGKK